jgi:translation initiation factor IF-2
VIANAIGVRTIDVVKLLIKMNECPTSSETFLNNDLVDEVVRDFGRIPKRGMGPIKDISPRAVPEDLTKFPVRSPVVAIMGHVDHGKTTLLDALRGSDIAAKEFGGITQRMAAFSVQTPHSPRPVTFIDTPGHAAFAKMRQRGADVTDIAVLVVAADEGIQEQTIQAIEYIQNSDVPMVVAITKCDKRGADPEKVRLQLNSRGVHMQKYGGDVLDVEVSAVEAEGLEDLIENILYTAEELGLNTDPTGPGEAEILDVRKEPHRGVVASCVLRLGSIKKGDAMIAGQAWGRMKHLFDEKGNIVQGVAPGMPFEVTGWEATPEPGDEMIICPDLAKAKSYASLRKLRASSASADKIFGHKQRQEIRDRELMQKDRIMAAQLGLDPAKFVRKQQELRAQFRVKEIPVFLKADAGGSLEAIKDSLSTLPHDEIKLRILRSDVGIISEQDIREAAMLDPKAMCIGFNAPLTPALKEFASKESVEINNFQIIYSLMDWVRVALGKHLTPREHIKVLAEALVQQIFPMVTRGETIYISGCLVTSGIFKKRISQVVRNGKIIGESTIRTLRHMKDDAKEITSGKECGIMLADDSITIQEGDIIQNIVKSYHQRVLGEPLVSKGVKGKEEPDDDEGEPL